MPEISFPVVEKPLTEDQWKAIAAGLGQGVIDRGGYPYSIASRSNTTDEVTIGVDVITKKNEAIVAGFVHQITEAKKLKIAPVTSTTTYEIGLVYDPTKHGTEAGPVTLAAWKAPGDMTGGKVRVVLWRITRSPNQVLTAATVQENRQRISPQISVSGTSDLPPSSSVLVDTVALVRVTGESYRADMDFASNSIKWVPVGGESSAVKEATYLPTPDTIMKRHHSGSARVQTGEHSQDATNIGWVNARINEVLGGTNTGDLVAPATPYPTPHSIMRRWDSGVARVGTTDGSHDKDIVNIEFADSRYRRRGSIANADLASGIDPAKLAKNLGDVPWEAVSGSTGAYATPQSGMVYTVSVNSIGRLMRFTSKASDKTNVQPLEEPVEKLLAPVPVKFNRIDHENDSVDERTEWGFIADHELEREDGTPNLVLTETDEDGNEHAESWDNFGLIAAHHAVLRVYQRKLEEMSAELTEIREELKHLREGR